MDWVNFFIDRIEIELQSWVETDKSKMSNFQ